MEKVIRYETQIKLVPSSMRKLNKQFALVDVLLCYHGRNRNGTDISKEVIESAIPSLYGIPIIGEYIYLDDGSQDFGSHGGKIIISDKGIEFEDTTVPYGFVTKDAVDHAKWVTVTEKDGIAEHEYLELKGCIVWLERYEEVSCLLDKKYGQSMEIVIDKGHYDDNGYFVIEDMTFSAVCILGSNPDGTDVAPCFESACIGRHYELDSFKKEFALMLDEYNKFSNQQMEKGEKDSMDFEKLDAFISSCTIGDVEGGECKYCMVGSPTETDFTVIDKEDNFKVYTVGYAFDDDGEVVADWEGKAERGFSVVDKDSEGAFVLSDAMDFSASIEKLAEEKAFKVTEELSATFKADIDGKDEEYRLLQEKFDDVSARLEAFENEKAEAAREAHRNEIDEVVKSFAAKLGRSPRFLVYKAKLNADEVTVDDVTRDLTLMVGQETLGKNGKFSYQPQETKVTGKDEAKNNRYGHLLDKYM